MPLQSVTKFFSDTLCVKITEYIQARSKGTNEIL